VAAAGPGFPVRGRHRADAWGSVNSFAFACALVERLAESEQAFAALRASADLASAPEAIAMLANGHAYVLTRMGRLR